MNKDILDKVMYFVLTMVNKLITLFTFTGVHGVTVVEKDMTVTILMCTTTQNKGIRQYVLTFV